MLCASFQPGWAILNMAEAGVEPAGAPHRTRPRTPAWHSTPVHRTPDRALIKEVISQTLLTMGIDPTEPTANQADHAYLRRLREGSERWGMKSRLLMLGSACTLVVSVVVLAIKFALTGEW